MCRRRDDLAALPAAACRCARVCSHRRSVLRRARYPAGKNRAKPARPKAAARRRAPEGKRLPELAKDCPRQRTARRQKTAKDLIDRTQPVTGRPSEVCAELAKILRYDANPFDRGQTVAREVLDAVQARGSRALERWRSKKTLSAAPRPCRTPSAHPVPGRSGPASTPPSTTATRRGRWRRASTTCSRRSTCASCWWCSPCWAGGAAASCSAPCWALAAFAAFVRLYRLSDGIIHKNYFRDVKLYVDMPHVARSVAAHAHDRAAAHAAGRHRAAGRAADGAHPADLRGARLPAVLSGPKGWRQRGVFLGVLVLCVGPVAAVAGQGRGRGGAPRPVHPQHRAPRASTSTASPSPPPLIAGPRSIEIRTVQDHLQSDARRPGPPQGGRLPPVLLVESYGSAVFRHRTLTGTGCPNIEEFTNSLSAKGYYVASKYLLSTTYGGGSWFAHATLRTGVAIRDSLEFSLILHRKPPPPTMAQHVQARPATARCWSSPGPPAPGPRGSCTGSIAATTPSTWTTRGPAFGFSTMPDQYVLHAIHQKEMVKDVRAPLFVEYALVSSHAPWTPVPGGGRRLVQARARAASSRTRPASASRSAGPTWRRAPSPTPIRSATTSTS